MEHVILAEEMATLPKWGFLPEIGWLSLSFQQKKAFKMP